MKLAGKILRSLVPLLFLYVGVASGAQLTGTVATAPTSVNLTAEGTADWAHWGPTASSFDRKSGVSQQISNITTIGASAIGYQGDSVWTFHSWSDGTPTASNGGTQALVYFTGVGHGYQLTVPADTTQRTLRIYLGGWMTQSLVQATLSDGSATAFTATIGNSSGNAYANMVTLTYAAAATGQTLTIKQTIVNDYGGNIGLQAVTLQGGSSSGSGTLSGAVGTSPSSVNLTVEGTADWAHWGPTSSSFDRKASVAQQISNITAIGASAIGYQGDSVWTFHSWTDGTPTAGNGGTQSLIYFTGLGHGYQLTLPADTTQRTVRIYVGGWMTQGQVQATLSDGSATPFTTTIGDSSGNAYVRVITLTYAAASAGRTLTIRHTIVTDYGGNIGLQAATLQAGSVAGNTPPTAAAQSSSTNEDVALPLTLAGSDADGNALTFAIVTAPSHGALGALNSISCTGTPSNCTAHVTYTPAANYNGSDSFSFKTNDGVAASTPATVTLTVNPVNDPPVLTTPGNQSVTEGQTLNFGVAASDPDVGDTLQITASSLPTGAGFTASGGSGTFTWTPPAGAAAGSPYSVTFTARDAANATDAQSVSIVVLSSSSGATLSGSVTTAPASVNLTAVGTADWAHWGPTAGTFNHKAGVAQQISNFTAIGTSANGYQGDTAWTAHSWSDGTPTVSSAGTQSLVYFTGVGHGYQLTVPADTTPRTVKIYLGGWMSQSQVQATLSDGSASSYTTTIGDSSGNVYARVITLTYSAASANQTLTIRHTIVTDYGGNIGLQAVALAGNAAVLTLPFTDNFDDGNSVGWAVVNESNVSPSWLVSAGQFLENNRVESLQTFDQTYHLGTFAYLSAGSTLTDYRFSVDATFLSSDGPDDLSDDLGVMFRYVDPNNYYRFTMNARYGFSRLEKKVAGVFTPLAVDGRGYVVGQTEHITIDVQGNKIQVLRNGVPLFAVQDSALSTGTVALYCQDRSTFDNVLIQAVGSSPSITLSTPTSYSTQVTNLLSVSAIATQVPTGGKVVFTLDGTNSITDTTEPYTATYSSVTPGNHTVVASLRNSSNVEIARDTNTAVGTTGEYFVAVGDSITNGIGDNFGTDDQSLNGRIIADEGMEAPLTNLLENSLGKQVMVFNEGIGGDDSSQTAFTRLNSIKARHPASQKVLLLIGTNDSNRGIPSGSGCSGTACNGTYKGNVQTVINSLTSAGKTVYVALVPPAFGSGSTIFTDPLNSWRNVSYIQPYNDVIRYELTGRLLGPDLFGYFLSSTVNRFSLFSDTLHPNGLGHVVLATLWHNALNPSAPAALPFVLDNLSRSTVAPYLKQNLLELDDFYYVDGSYRLTSIPSVLANGRWIMTANADVGNTSSNYLTFNVDRPVTVYVAYDAGAASRPTWMGAFTDTGLSVGTTNPAGTSMRLYSRTYNAGSITLGGNLAAGASGADANYIAIVVAN